jgi:hypothetical protein
VSLLGMTPKNRTLPRFRAKFSIHGSIDYTTVRNDRSIRSFRGLSELSKCWCNDGASRCNTPPL